MTRALSIEEWENLDEDETGEWVDGRIVEEELPTFLHQMIAMQIAHLFMAWGDRRGAVTLGSDSKYIVSQRAGRKPDVSVYLPGRALPGRDRGASRRPPSVVVEVLSPQPRDVRRDMVDKLREYAGFGVQYYWIIDPLARTLEVRQLDPSGRHVTLLSAADGQHAAPGCEGLTIDLDALWATADRLPESEG